MAHVLKRGQMRECVTYADGHSNRTGDDKIEKREHVRGSGVDGKLGTLLAPGFQFREQFVAGIDGVNTAETQLCESEGLKIRDRSQDRPPAHEVPVSAEVQ